MSAGENEPTYGATAGPQDGQGLPPPRPIPIEQPPGHPAPGEPAGVARQPEPGATAVDPRSEQRSKRLDGLMSISGGLAMIAFFVLGFAFDAWAWAWIVFMIPGLLHTYRAASQ